MQRHVGYILLVTVLALMALGIIMLISTSAKFAPESAGAMYALLRRQAVWIVIGGGLCMALSRTDYHKLTQYAPWALGGSIFLLMLCFVPHLGKMVNGSRRWIEVGGMTLQPSECAKLSLIVFLAGWFGQHQRAMHEFWKGFGVPALATGGIAFFLLLQPDLGYTALIGAIFFVMAFCAGAKLRYLLPVPVLGIGGILTLAYAMPERRGRLLAFMDPEKYRLTDGHQVWQALIAFGSGGASGLGLGSSRQKMYWLPEAHTDFVFPIVGEELGMWVALSVVLAFLLLVLVGAWISLHAPDPAGVLLGVGVTTMLGLQALLNFAVVTSLMPNKGLPLPFISYGGSNLMLCMACIGVLFNLHRQAVYETTAPGSLLQQRVNLRM